ncbi:hypothetical protein Pmar_PMAR022357 [Perkinsus marinus ATCC 50983]|uniref:Methyltransferase FkbM domain-containing protein n=1 Tax=Perkinsus marinus (strain ATCC 50983 / TXsc) TaxID=423536 RepID=C5KDV4_PERM5|nr:hypothetical protein Pmar_PMAR022357 [Perkinsus marinus ATCC 50983]EER17407.1 hypothetical protein Pmar_PMAR022357 [Perkinsus marinus ATCC 50983]|eukprot:XP_002785611.1 hypothetical protein Pmar_PMAR022357 [Perkinsus marinus ATCC 50983]
MEITSAVAGGSSRSVDLLHLVQPLQAEKAQQGPSAESDIATRKRRIFIDLGANDGQSLDFLVKWKEREGKEFDPLEWEVYFFELNPQWETKLKSRCQENQKIAICIPIMAGAWTKTGQIGYFKDAAISKPKTKHGIEVHYDSVGTSLYNRKEEQAAKGKKGAWREDGCVVDFSGWLRRVVPMGQMEEVLLKVDIEGSEYELMEHLIESGVMEGRVTVVALEWHPKIFSKSAKLGSVEEESKARSGIIRGIQSQNVKYMEWEY